MDVADIFLFVEKMSVPISVVICSHREMQRQITETSYLQVLIQAYFFISCQIPCGVFVLPGDLKVKVARRSISYGFSQYLSMVLPTFATVELGDYENHSNSNIHSDRLFMAPLLILFTMHYYIMFYT